MSEISRRTQYGFRNVLNGQCRVCFSYLPLFHPHLHYDPRSGLTFNHHQQLYYYYYYFYYYYYYQTLLHACHPSKPRVSKLASGEKVREDSDPLNVLLRSIFYLPFCHGFQITLSDRNLYILRINDLWCFFLRSSEALGNYYIFFIFKILHEFLLLIIEGKTNSYNCLLSVTKCF